jgi:EAL domain-containing protein (putative c-di-GMP-specific phosphodiesterase class I)
VLAETGWPAELLQLELTESALMNTPGGSPAALHALVDMGVRIAIDDFGTGYSNLAYLRHLPVQVLKLAGSFVTGAAGGAAGGGTTDDVDREVVGLIIRLAHTLGLTVTAESVETRAQFAHLQGLGCDTGQGWFFAPAVPAAEVPALAAEQLGSGAEASEWRAAGDLDARRGAGADPGRGPEDPPPGGRKGADGPRSGA